MTIKELKVLIQNLPDDMEVLTHETYSGEYDYDFASIDEGTVISVDTEKMQYSKKKNAKECFCLD